MPALPYSKKRYYLSGIDWIISAINSYMRSVSPAGNHSSLVIELDAPPEAEKLTQCLDSIFSALPPLSGRTARDKLNLCPYFRVKPGAGGNYQFAEHEVKDDGSFNLLLDTILNTPFPDEKTHLMFSLIKFGAETCELRSFLVMTFDHRILDARGAELFLNLLAEMGNDKLTARLKRIKITDAPELRDWNKQFDAGRKVQRKIISLTQDGCFCPSEFTMNNIMPRKTPNLTHYFRTFSEQETEVLLENAEKKAGYMMETPYLLAAAALTVHKIFAGGKTENYFVPVPIDVRAKGDESRLLLFNHLSFLFFYFKISHATTEDELICELRRQLFIQIGEDFPDLMIKAANPGRIFPFFFLKKVMRYPMQGKMSSFVFANVGESSCTGGDIASCGIRNIMHMPRIPTPPGLGLFFSRFNGKMNMTVTADNSALPKGTAEQVIEVFSEGRI